MKTTSAKGTVEEVFLKHGRDPFLGLPKNKKKVETNMGVSENSVPLNPMVNDHYPY
jgi:hypothetical protein